MDLEVTKHKIISSLLWKFMERIGVQGIQFIVTLLLARLLLPEDFGLLVIVMIFITIATVVAQNGFNTALIQKKDADEIDFSSVFYLNLILATILYIILFFTAPFIALLFDQPQLTLVLRYLSLTLFLGPFQSIQYAIISRTMQFKKLFVSSLGGVILSGTVGIVMAYMNYGIWSLVVQQLLNQLVITLILYYTLNWRPQLIFSLDRLRILFTFGWKLLISSLIDSVYSNIRNVFVGKLFSPAMLGFYNRGEQFPYLFIAAINGSIQSVLFPALSSQQDDKKKVKIMVRRAIVSSSFIVFPMMIGLAVIAEPLVKVLLTEKWLPAVPFLQIFCVVYIVWPIHTANLQAINAIGRSDIFLKLEIIKKVIGLIILILSIPLGVYAMAVGVLISSLLAVVINAFPNIVLLNYSLREQFFDIAPSLFISITMGVIVYTIKWFGFGDVLTIVIQILLGIVVYIVLSKLFKLEPFHYLFETIKGVLKRNKSVPIKEAYE